MKCETYVLKNKRGRVTNICTLHHRLVDKFSVPEGAELCDGNIKVSLRAVSDGCSCCGTPELEINYLCDKCGNSIYQELPSNTTELAELVTAALAAMTSKQRKKLLDVRQEEQNRRDQYLKEYQASLQKVAAAVKKTKKPKGRKPKVKK